MKRYLLALALFISFFSTAWCMNNGGARSQRQIRANAGELDQGGVNDACEIYCKGHEHRRRPITEHDIEHDFQLRRDLRKYGPPRENLGLANINNINPNPSPSWRKPLAIAGIVLGTIAVVVAGIFIYKKIRENNDDTE